MAMKQGDFTPEERAALDALMRGDVVMESAPWPHPSGYMCPVHARQYDRDDYGKAHCPLCAANAVSLQERLNRAVEEGLQRAIETDPAWWARLKRWARGRWLR